MGRKADNPSAYRYALTRSWTFGAGTVVFIMLNPSTADEVVDDPTVRRCIRFAQRWGFARLQVVNLFAYRSTDPSELVDVADPIGCENDETIRAIVACADRTVCAWGGWGRVFELRVRKVLGMFPRTQFLLCLGVTQDGQPRHPLYVPYAQQLEVFHP